MHDDLVEPAHVEHIVLVVAIQDVAIALGIESEAILANASLSGSGQLHTPHSSRLYTSRSKLPMPLSPMCSV